MAHTIEASTQVNSPRRGGHIFGGPIFDRVPDLPDIPTDTDYLIDEGHQGVTAVLEPDPPYMMDRLLTADSSELSAVFGGYGHDINNRLSAASNAVELALDFVESPEARHFLEVSLSNLERGMELSRHIVDVVRAQERPMRPIALDKIITASVEAKAPQFDAENIAVEMEISPSTPQVLGEKGLLSDVFTNLLVNAYDAIRSRRAREELDPDDVMRVGISSFADPDRAEAVLLVSDTGIGMEREVMDKIGEPFNTNGKEKGIGLGLFMVRRTVIGHGGTLDVQSVTSNMISQRPHLYGDMTPGTTFTIRLPAHR